MLLPPIYSIQEQIAKVKFFKDQIGANSTDSSLNRAIQVLEQGKRDVLNLSIVLNS